MASTMSMNIDTRHPLFTDKPAANRCIEKIGSRLGIGTNNNDFVANQLRIKIIIK